jgi:hypothetical protein
VGVGRVEVSKWKQSFRGTMFLVEVRCSGAGVGLGGRGWRGEVIWVGRVGGGRFDETKVV